MPTYIKESHPNGEDSIRVDGITGGSIYLKIVPIVLQEVQNSVGVHRVLGAYAQELDAQGDEIPGATGPVARVTLMEKVILEDPGAGLRQRQKVRKLAIRHYLSQRQTAREFANMPNNLANVEGDI